MAQKQGPITIVIERMRIVIRGAVQGVGFRPFVYRLASELCLCGWVQNTAQGIFLEVEGPTQELNAFRVRIDTERPAHAFIQSLESSVLDPVGFTSFEIRESEAEGVRSALVLPDIAVCPDCVREIFDPANRRFRYPFTNCTNCGPRFSIIEALPYDRANTAMRAFDMCPLCRGEYEDPQDRRFHAQPNACPACGPRLELWNEEGHVLGTGDDALVSAAECIRKGGIAAAKGLGGFHLLADARNESAVTRLRERKSREEKPFALMYPSLARVRAECALSAPEERLLNSPEAPIVLLRSRNASVVSSVAPRNPYLGVMLPYTPMHHLLMKELDSPVVATSGNRADEPICTDERDALIRLGGIADIFLVHNRPIVRHVDDSIARVLLDRELLLRRARGYAPLPIRLDTSVPEILAVGAHLKSTIARTVDRNVFISQHIGDLETEQAARAFSGVIASFGKLYESVPSRVAADMHPDYFSTRIARRLGPQVTFIQHHHAHVVSCMAENQLEGTVLGVSWDGTGYGTDGTVWGGEFLLAERSSFRRAASLRRFRLPGGEQAVREPRRSALGLLYEVFGAALIQNRELAPLRAFSARELETILRMLARGVNVPWTSSAGRLFDAVSSIAGLRQKNSFEGQAAMELEFATEEDESEEWYPFEVVRQAAAGGIGEFLSVDWAPAVRALISDVDAKAPAGKISRKFHNALAQIIVDVARQVGEKRIVLTGGCFQNGYLLQRAVRRLQDEGLRPYWHQRVPPNDGGIALGQAVAAATKDLNTDAH